VYGLFACGIEYHWCRDRVDVPVVQQQLFFEHRRHFFGQY
jgi:hypothetical protein